MGKIKNKFFVNESSFLLSWKNKIGALPVSYKHPKNKDINLLYKRSNVFFSYHIRDIVTTLFSCGKAGVVNGVFRNVFYELKKNLNIFPYLAPGVVYSRFLLPFEFVIKQIGRRGFAVPKAIPEVKQLILAQKLLAKQIRGLPDKNLGDRCYFLYSEILKENSTFISLIFDSKHIKDVL